MTTTEIEVWTWVFLFSGERRFAENAFRSEDESDAGGDQQCVDNELELSVREPLENAQAEPRAEQGGRDEGKHLPVELPLHGRCRPHQMDCDQGHRLHCEDEGLIHAALVRLVPSLQAAPDSDKGPGGNRPALR
jgi:hypothetical protein